MSDLISRSALIEDVQKCFVNSCIHRNDLAEILANLPTVEAKPVVRGKWRKYEDIDCVEFIKCSKCGGIFYDGDNDTFDTPYNFCPNCGADMRKKVQE